MNGFDPVTIGLVSTSDRAAGGVLPGLDALGITPAALQAVAPLYLAPRGANDGLDRYRRTAGR